MAILGTVESAEILDEKNTVSKLDILQFCICDYSALASKKRDVKLRNGRPYLIAFRSASQWLCGDCGKKFGFGLNDFTKKYTAGHTILDGEVVKSLQRLYFKPL